MRNRICIPNTLCVGFQRMRDTYTGRLAYITYYDNTGKLKKGKFMAQFDRPKYRASDNYK